MPQCATAPKFFRLLKILAIARETYNELQSAQDAESAEQADARLTAAVARFDQSLMEPAAQSA